MSTKWFFKLDRFTGKRWVQIRKANDAARIYILHREGHSWAEAERLNREFVHANARANYPEDYAE